MRVDSGWLGRSKKEWIARAALHFFLGSMPAPLIKTCERCQKQFDCYREDVDNCECALVVLQPWQKEWLGKNFQDCLCSDCLREVSELDPNLVQASEPAGP